MNMLIISFHNDGTGNVKTANYNWAVDINSLLIASGELRGHDLSKGWQGLVKKFAKSIEPKRGKKK